MIEKENWANMLKKFLLLITIFFLVLSSFPVSGKKIYSVDGFELPRIDQLKLAVRFMTWGSERQSDGRLPTFTVREGVTEIVSITSQPAGESYWYAYWTCPDPPASCWIGSMLDIDHNTFFTGSSIIPIDEEIYTFDIASYGDGFSELGELIPWFGPAWTCNAFLATYSLPIDVVCYHHGNDCNEYSDSAGFMCNGIWAGVYFYDEGENLIHSLNSDDWPSERRYDSLGYTWLTDTTPGPEVHITQTLDIQLVCEDECDFVGETGCDSSSQEWNCVMGIEGCYIKQSTDCETCESCAGIGPCAFNSSACFDCGLRVQDQSLPAPPTTFACGPEASWPLKIKGIDGNLYSIVLVDPLDPFASKTRVQTSGGIRALRKL